LRQSSSQVSRSPFDCQAISFPPLANIRDQLDDPQVDAIQESDQVKNGGLRQAIHLDVKLTSLFDKFCRERSAYLAVFDDVNCMVSPEQLRSKLNKHSIAYHATIRAMCVTPAASQAGLAAKARIVKDYRMGSDDEMHPLAFSLLDDCIRLGEFFD
jgi:hypothetical protein